MEATKVVNGDVWACYRAAEGIAVGLHGAWVPRQHHARIAVGRQQLPMLLLALLFDPHPPQLLMWWGGGG